MLDPAHIHAEIDRTIAHREEETVRRLIRWAEQNSGSTNGPGLEAMARLLEVDLVCLEGDAERVVLAPAQWVDDRGELRERSLGDALRIRKRQDVPIQLLLVGHMDTVFGPEDPFREVILDRAAGLLRGPGVADAKGGLAVAALALEAFEQLDIARHVGWEVWISPDEELGSPGTAPLLREAARRFAIGLVFEPTQAGGDLTGARKGSGNYTLVVRGRSAHAGRNPEEGRNAIDLAARAVVALQEWSLDCGGVSVNVGVFHGGTARNIVPDLAVVHFTVRVVTASDQERVEGWLRDLVERLGRQEGVAMELHGGFTRPPRPLDPPSAALLDGVVSMGAGMGVSLGWRDSGGVSDVNVLAAAGLPAVDGLGPVGGGLHTDGEHIHLDSLAERARLSARFLAAIATGEIALPMDGGVPRSAGCASAG